MSGKRVSFRIIVSVEIFVWIKKCLWRSNNPKDIPRQIFKRADTVTEKEFKKEVSVINKGE